MVVMTVPLAGSLTMEPLYLVPEASSTLTCVFYGYDGVVEWTKSGESAAITDDVTTDE